jgi:hypothetical protein
MLMTVDEAGKPVTVTVRVGQAVDVVGQAGRPKTITGFQTHTTPVLLGHGERAELATDECTPSSHGSGWLSVALTPPPPPLFARTRLAAVQDPRGAGHPAQESGPRARAQA